MGAVAIVIWSLLMLGLGKALFSGGGDEKPVANSSRNKQAVSVVKKVSNKAADRDYTYGFSLKYPDGWGELDRDALRQKDPFAVAGFRKLEDKSNPSVIVKIERAQKATLDGLIPALREKMKSELKDFKEESSGKTKLGKADAIEMTYTWMAAAPEKTDKKNETSEVGYGEKKTEKALPLKQRMIIGLRNGWAYYLISSAEASGFNEVKAEFNKIITTFNMN